MSRVSAPQIDRPFSPNTQVHARRPVCDASDEGEYPSVSEPESRGITLLQRDRIPLPNAICVRMITWILRKSTLYEDEFRPDQGFFGGDGGI